MALPDYYKVQPGSPIVWKESGGNYAITPKNKANNTARAGAKGDLTAQFSRRWRVTLQTKLAVAGNNGSEIELYWSGSDSATAGTGNAGSPDGTDSDLANFDELKRQMIPVGSLIVSNALGTNEQIQHMEFFPIAGMVCQCW